MLAGICVSHCLDGIVCAYGNRGGAHLASFFPKPDYCPFVLPFADGGSFFLEPYLFLLAGIRLGADLAVFALASDCTDDFIIPES